MSTKLDRVLSANDISTLSLVRETRQHDPRGRGYSRNHIYAVRRGETEPTRHCMSVILASVRRLSGDRTLRAEDLFEFSPIRRTA